jgi:hypothetical protein
MEKEAKRVKRAEKDHRGDPHIPGECPRCLAAISERTASPPSSSADASTQMDDIAGGHGGTRIQPRPEGVAADLFMKGRDEWARYMGIAQASGPQRASTLQSNQGRPQRSNPAGGNLPQTSSDEINVNLDKPREERRELLRYVEQEGLYVPSAQWPPGIGEALRPKSRPKKRKRCKE